MDMSTSQVDCGQLDGEEFSKEHGFAGYFETSAKTGIGIKEAVHFMVKKVCTCCAVLITKMLHQIIL